MASCPGSRKSVGFTLIELLVVITLIAILAAILAPIFAAARRKAKFVQCTENTRQLTRAMLLYANDYANQGPPLTGWGMDCWTSDVRYSPLWKYLKSGVQTRAITCCPNDSTGRKWTISMNGFLVGTWFFFACGSTGGPEGMCYDMYSQPARLPAWVCENTDERLGVTVNDTDFCNEDITSINHEGRCTLTYLDGHSGTLKGILKWNTAKWPDGSYIFRPASAL